MGLFSSLITGGTQLLGTHMTNVANEKQQQREMDFQRENYDIQRQDVLEDRAHEEAYNSPIQQAQRLRQAGMNPMDYMSDPVATSTGSSGEIGSAPHIEKTSPIETLGKFMQQDREFNLAQAEYDLNKTNSEISNAYTAEQTRAQQIANDREEYAFEEEKRNRGNRDTVNDNNAELSNLEVAYTKSAEARAISESTARLRQMNASAEAQEFANSLAKELKDNTIAQAQETLANLKKSGKEIDSSTALNYATKKLTEQTTQLEENKTFISAVEKRIAQFTEQYRKNESTRSELISAKNADFEYMNADARYKALQQMNSDGTLIKLVKEQLEKDGNLAKFQNDEIEFMAKHICLSLMGNYNISK